MNTDTAQQIQTRVYTTENGHVAIEQSKDSIVVIPPDQILSVIRELHVCYDYCAIWKEEERSTSEAEAGDGSKTRRS